MTLLTVELHEGRYLQGFCCLDCRPSTEDASVAVLGVAPKARAYVVALNCEDCSREVVRFNQFSEEVQ